MEDIIFITIVLGVCLLVLQFYSEIQIWSDDKYLFKSTTRDVIQKLEKKREEKKLTLGDSVNLSLRVFIFKRTLLKIGAILICIGIILKVIF